jgi:glycosyltransferase involved in cell wall biosynthesis
MSVSRELVLFVAPWELRLPGGVSEVLRNLARLANLSGEVRSAVLVPDWSAPIPVMRERDGLREYRFRCVAPWNVARPLQHLLRLPLWFPGAWRHTLAFLREVRPRVINVHFPDISTLTLVWAARRAVPSARVVLSFHGSDVHKLETASPTLRWCWGRLLRSVDAITCCSEDLRRRLLAAAGPLSNVAVAYNGVDEARLHEEVAQGSVPATLAGCRFVASVAKFEHKKGLDVLVRAFADLVAGHPDLMLALAGADGPTLERTRRLARELGLEDRTWFGVDVRHADALALIRQAEMFVLPSRQEPFGIVLLEAAVFRVPVVATMVGGVPEVVEDGVTGLLVPAEDAPGLARAMDAVLRDRASAEARAAGACRRVASTFTWEAAFACYLGILRGRVPAA